MMQSESHAPEHLLSLAQPQSASWRAPWLAWLGRTQGSWLAARVDRGGVCGAQSAPDGPVLCDHCRGDGETAPSRRGEDPALAAACG